MLLKLSAVPAVILAALIPVFLTACASKDPPLRTVEKVDLQRYLGLWYEYALYPNWFERDCVASTATYSLKADGDIDVLNECRLKSVNGEYKSARGTAKVVDPVTNSKLKVTFFWPFYGKYWVIDLDPDYRWAVVGHPDRDYLWVLSRSPELDAATFQGISERLRAQGYDPAKLIRTPHRASVGTP